MKKQIFIILIVFTSNLFADEIDCTISSHMAPLHIFDKYQETRKLSDAIYSISDEHPCNNFFKAACTKEAPKDPTGAVIPIMETVTNRKIFEEQDIKLREILVEWNKLPKDDRPYKDDYLAEEYYKRNNFDSKLDKWDKQLQIVKGDIISYFKVTASPSVFEEIEEKIKDIIIRRDYTLNPGHLFESTAFPGGNISIGGNLLNTMTSESAIHYLLTHELGHTISEIANSTHQEVKSCIEGKFGKMETVNGYIVDQDEIWADWFANRVYQDYIISKTEDDDQRIEYMKNTLRALCGYGGSEYGHPSGNFRMSFLAMDPKLNSIICKDFVGKKTKREYCP